ncbi:hypothetical protein [Kibdelosporangium phytohabitans]|uniref:hypothetical protein n=1 Tax=Kibdelosporangium phytohabitans TaxID=860235 RepID=UPI0019F41F59|nr:type VI protein secretion system component VasF [Kibdelosporangium phytohabitans]
MLGTALEHALPAQQGNEAHETLEDHTLGFAPRTYRRWSPAVVGASALGGMAYMADFSIGAGIGLTHGTSNALLAVLCAAVVILVTGFPLATTAPGTTSTST